MTSPAPKGQFAEVADTSYTEGREKILYGSNMNVSDADVSVVDCR